MERIQSQGRLGVFHGPGLMGGDAAGQFQDTVVPVLPDGTAVSGIALDELEFQPPAKFLRRQVDCPARAVYGGHFKCISRIPTAHQRGVSADAEGAVRLHCGSCHADDYFPAVDVGLGGIMVSVREENFREGGCQERSNVGVALPLIVEEELPGRAVQPQNPLSTCLVEAAAVLGFDEVFVGQQSLLEGGYLDVCFPVTVR